MCAARSRRATQARHRQPTTRRLRLAGCRAASPRTRCPRRSAPRARPERARSGTTRRRREERLPPERESSGAPVFVAESSRVCGKLTDTRIRCENYQDSRSDTTRDCLPEADNPCAVKVHRRANHLLRRPKFRMRPVRSKLAPRTSGNGRTRITVIIRASEVLDRWRRGTGRHRCAVDVRDSWLSDSRQGASATAHDRGTDVEGRGYLQRCIRIDNAHLKYMSRPGFAAL